MPRAAGFLGAVPVRLGSSLGLCSSQTRQPRGVTAPFYTGELGVRPPLATTEQQWWDLSWASSFQALGPTACPALPAVSAPCPVLLPRSPCSLAPAEAVPAPALGWGRTPLLWPWTLALARRLAYMPTAVFGGHLFLDVWGRRGRAPVTKQPCPECCPWPGWCGDARLWGLSSPRDVPGMCPGAPRQSSPHGSPCRALPSTVCLCAPNWQAWGPIRLCSDSLEHHFSKLSFLKCV